MNECNRETVPIRTVLGLIALAIAVICAASICAASICAASSGRVHAEEGEVPAANASDLACQECFIPISLADLRSAEDLTIVQDSDGPAVRVFEVCQSVRGYADFEPNLTHEFPWSLFGRAWLYAEIEEIGSTVEPDGTYSLSLSADVVVSNADMRVVWEKNRACSFDEKLSSPAFGIWAYVYVPTVVLGKGEYNVEITVNDNTNGKRSRVNTLVRIK